MKTKDFVRKYKLDKDVILEEGEHIKFNKTAFLKDFEKEFEESLQKNCSVESTVERFDHVIIEMRQKWDGIDRKTRGGLSEGLWKFFYATILIEKKKEIFPEWAKRVEEERAEASKIYKAKQDKRKKEWEEREEAKKRNAFYDIDSERLFEYIKNILGEASFRKFMQGEFWTYSNYNSPSVNYSLTESFQILGISEEATEQEIKKAYRQLAHKYHPDKGGDHAEFIKVTQALQECMKYKENMIEK
jgi:hypothetical protein